MSFFQSFISSIRVIAKRSKMFQIQRMQCSLAASKDPLVLTERMGKLFLIGINRPEKRNCVNLEIGQLLISAFEEFEKDETLCVAILHGKGGNFCSGMDLAEVASFKDPSAAKVYTDLMSTLKRPMGPSHMRFTKPTIAAISGYAVAGGLELALLCDLRVVEETAVMGIFNRRFGVPLIDGGTVRLPKLIGLSRALDLILTGRGINAEEALQFGLANRIVACGTALGQAINLGNSIAKFPQECLKADRRSTFYSTYDSESFSDAMEYEMNHSKNIITVESVKGASKFVSGVGRHGKFNIDHDIHEKL